MQKQKRGARGEVTNVVSISKKKMQWSLKNGKIHIFQCICLTQLFIRETMPPTQNVYIRIQY